MYVFTSSLSGLPVASEPQGGISKKTSDYLEVAPHQHQCYFLARRLKVMTTLEHVVRAPILAQEKDHMKAYLVRMNSHLNQ